MNVNVAFGTTVRYFSKPYAYIFALLADLSGSREFQLTLEIKTSSKFRPVRESCIQVEYVTSLLTAMRQFCGLMHFSKSLLVSDILKPRKAVYFCSEDYQQSSLVSKVLQRKLILSPSTTLDSVMIITAVILICLIIQRATDLWW